MMYEGTCWRVDYKSGPATFKSVIVLAQTLEAAQKMAQQAIPDAEVVGFYALGGVRGAVYEGGK